MKPFFVSCLLATAALLLTPPPARADPPLEGIRRIAFLGDSITQSGEYVTDVECELLAQGHHLEILNLGLSSETATALTAQEHASHVATFGFPRPWIGDRLDRTLAATQPDLFFVCYGMNDGSSLPESAEGLRRFQEAITTLRRTALSSGVERIVLCTPPIHDPAPPSDPAMNPHARNLVSYRDWLLTKRADGWEVVDIHGPMRRDLDAARAIQPAARFQPDGVHPDRTGHWIMAREILNQYFGTSLEGTTPPQPFPTNGDAIRGLVQQRQQVLYASWMTHIRHTRPQVPGGPGAAPGLSLEAAAANAQQITHSIDALVKPSVGKATP